MPLPTISVVIPVYNSEDSLKALIQRLCPVLQKHASVWEIILVNDNSRDGSWSVIEALTSQYPEIAGINLMRNYGQHSALLCGIRACRHELTVTIDDDLQNPPEEIPVLLGGFATGADAVYGVPEHQQHGFMRDIASQLTKLVLQKAMGANVARSISAFRAFRTQTRDAFSHYSSPLVNIDVLLTWGTTRFCAVVVKHDPRTYGRSNYTVRKLIVHAINMLTGFSTFPLQLSSWIGFAFTLVGFGILVWVLGRYVIQGGSVPGFPFLASVIAIFSGAQLFALGIMGEYIARIHLRMMGRPPYTVRTEIRCAGQADRAAS